MKEVYISPELRLIGFVSAQRLADLGGFDMDDLLGGETGSLVPGASVGNNDIDAPVNG